MATGVPENCVPEGETLDIPNVTTDFGLSPPYNGMFALFGQFFDHGVDFTKKTKNYVMMPLAEDDPLYVPGGRTNFMLLNRAENQAGPDGDPRHRGRHPGRHQHGFAVGGPEPDLRVPSRRTRCSCANTRWTGNKPVATGELIEGEPGGMATWAHVEKQARELLGLDLSDYDVADIPKIATDQYGRFLRGPNGLPQYETATGRVEGNLTTPVAPPANVERIGIAFLDDIAHNAAPFNSQTGAPLTADSDSDLNPVTQPLALPGTYDNEQLAAHFIAGDGRVNENIGLTAIHQVFHSEHNRLVGYMQDLVTTQNIDLNEWKLPNGAVER